MSWTLVLWMSISFSTLTGVAVPMASADACEIAARSWGEGALCIDSVTGETRIYKKEAGQ